MDCPLAPHADACHCCTQTVRTCLKGLVQAPAPPPLLSLPLPTSSCHVGASSLCLPGAGITALSSLLPVAFNLLDVHVALGLDIALHCMCWTTAGLNAESCLWLELVGKPCCKPGNVCLLIVRSFTVYFLAGPLV